MPSSEEKQRSVEKLASLFGSTVQLDRILRSQFPHIANYYQARWRSDALERRVKGLEACQAALTAGLPSVEEIMESDHSNPRLRKKLRDRFLKQIAEAFDTHFPRPGGRSAAPLAAHEALMARLDGATWPSISARVVKHGAEDRARKLVGRDRKILNYACWDLLDKCGLESDAPQEVKTEFETLMRQAS
jgi:hypothetical protein